MAVSRERGPVGAGECFSALVRWRDASVANFTDSTEYRYCHGIIFSLTPDPSDQAGRSAVQTAPYL